MFWAGVNNQVLGSIKDLGITLGALAIGIPAANAAVLALMASMRSFNTITATTSAYQIALATLFQGQASLAMLQFRNALIATTIQIRAFTASLFASPLGWIILALGGVASAFYALKQSAESTKRAIEDINNTQSQNVNKTKNAIAAIKELQGVQNLNLEQTKRLDSAIAFLTAQYPKYINKLREELRLKGEITRATAEQIAQEMTLQKVKGLQEQRIKLNKDMMRDVKISTIVGLGNNRVSNILQGNTDIKNGFANLFNSIRKSWADTISQMIAQKAQFLLFGDMAQGGGFLKLAGNLITENLFGFKAFAVGGIAPGNFSQPVPIVAHGSEMILNPFQQTKLWDTVVDGSNNGGGQAQSGGAPVIINQISPSFQSLDPAPGQKMFNDWMKQSGIPLVRSSIKNNDFQMRDTVKNV